MNLKNLSTESRNPKTINLDTFSSLEITTIMNDEDATLAAAVKPALPKIAQAADWAAKAFNKNGRLFYIGAGTSGRLGVLDASECPPTFGVPPTMVIGLIAGGDTALRNPVENAEDDEQAGQTDLAAHNLNSNDVVVGIAASGSTPYVIGGFKYANQLGCNTVSISCNKGSAMAQVAKLAIEVVPGPEILTGSTRLKSGTVQKMILNMISTAAMVRIGKTYENLMVDVLQSNKKLNIRAENIVMEVTDVSREEARTAIDEAGGNVKIAITMLLTQNDKAAAEALLEQASGHVRKALSLSSKGH